MEFSPSCLTENSLIIRKEGERRVLRRTGKEHRADGRLMDPAIPLLGIHTEETRFERDTCTPVFIAALFTIARTWKQPRCPSKDEWIRKLWYIYTSITQPLKRIHLNQF